MLATTIIPFLVILLVLILVHELGHFFTAKLFKIKVEEFGIFLPPRAWGKKIGETIYSINWLPLGGFVRLSGEEDPKAPGSLAGKSIPVRLVTLGAGSLMNLLLPFVLLTIAFMIPHWAGVEDASAQKVEVLVQEVRRDSPAASAGIRPGDVIVSVNGEQLSSADDYSRHIQSNLGKPITVVLRRADSSIVEVKLTPRTQWQEGEGPTGVAISNAVKKSYNPWEALINAVKQYWQILALFTQGIAAVFRGTTPFEVAGPVGIAQVTGEVARLGIVPLLNFAALISINLGLVNILPLPALDGGRIVFVLLEWVRRGKRVSPETERLIHSIGFALLLFLLLLATWNDIGRIMSGRGFNP
ncbi:MAG: RIP metalloprotease RseP [Dehalococcoidia bacterium]|nr:RIP metalloprotease RseP [Dehalococcoidia bacterium]